MAAEQIRKSSPLGGQTIVPGGHASLGGAGATPPPPQPNPWYQDTPGVYYFGVPRGVTELHLEMLGGGASGVGAGFTIAGGTGGSGGGGFDAKLFGALIVQSGSMKIEVGAGGAKVQGAPWSAGGDTVIYDYDGNPICKATGANAFNQAGGFAVTQTAGCSQLATECTGASGKGPAGKTGGGGGVAGGGLFASAGGIGGVAGKDGTAGVFGGGGGGGGAKVATTTWGGAGGDGAIRITWTPPS